MTEHQLIITLALMEETKNRSVLNSSRNCFEQPGFCVPMELSEYRELDNIIQYLKDVLEDIPAVVT